MKSLGAWPSRNSKPKTPLMTMHELAATVGLTCNQLRAHFGKSPIDTPKAVSEYCSNMTRKHKIRYYSPVEFKRWWVEYIKVVNVKGVDNGNKSPSIPS